LIHPFFKKTKQVKTIFHSFNKIFVRKKYDFNSTLTDFKINQFLPLIPKGNWLIFQLSPFWVWGKKAEKSQKNLICQSRINMTKVVDKG
jgi:hypothetical protein